MLLDELIREVRSAIAYWEQSFPKDYIESQEEELRTVNNCDPEYCIFINLKSLIRRFDYDPNHGDLTKLASPENLK